eukprot:Nk52_evm46s2657 gene=Nk52_evmTU46s2657
MNHLVRFGGGNSAMLGRISSSFQSVSKPRFYSGGMASIGFIGLGNMGAHMAKNLMKAGHPLTVYDKNPSAIAIARGFGANTAKGAAEVAANCSVVITMLPSSPHVKEVYLGKDGLIASAKPDTLFIDSSTIDPMVSREVGLQAGNKGMKFIDAPVSGGVVGAEAGTLTFMVGGSEKDFKESQECLKHMGKNVVHCGRIGNGQVAKICNNMVLGISMAAVAEGMNLGIKLGMEPKLLASIFNSSSARCWSSDTYNPVPGVMEGVPAARDYEGGFGVALIAKDLGLANNAAAEAKAPIMFGSLAHQVYSLMANQGLDKKDCGAIFKYLSEKEF